MGRLGVRHEGEGGARDAPGRLGAPDGPDGREAGDVLGVYALAATRSPGVMGVSGGAKNVATRFPITKPVDTGN